MPLKNEIAEERIRINKAVQRSKFGQLIVNNVIDPLLSSIENEMEDVAEWIGEFIVAHLREIISRSDPSGREYEIVLVDVNASDAEDAYTPLGTYQASSPGQPPASFDNLPLPVPTGTLFDSIGFEVSGDGRVRVGIFDSTGSEYASLFYRAGKIFVTEDKKGSKSNVKDYANYLDETGNRPWFRKPMEELRPKIREKIRERLNKALKSYKGKRKGRNALYFRVYFENKNELVSTTSTPGYRSDFE